MEDQCILLALYIRVAILTDEQRVLCIDTYVMSSSESDCLQKLPVFCKIASDALLSGGPLNMCFAFSPLVWLHDMMRSCFGSRHRACAA